MKIAHIHISQRITKLKYLSKRSTIMFHFISFSVFILLVHVHLVLNTMNEINEGTCTTVAVCPANSVMTTAC